MARSDSEKRQHLLEAAIAVFAARGLEGATIRAVGRQAGVNSALLYYYFENKETLFEQALRHVIAELLQQLDRERRPFSGPRDRVTFLVNGLMDYCLAHPERIHLMSATLILQPALFARILRGFLTTHRPIPIEVLQEGFGCGDFRHGHPLHAWLSIMGVVMHSLAMREAFGEGGRIVPSLPPFSIEARREHIIDLLTRGLTEPADERQRGRRP